MIYVITTLVTFITDQLTKLWIIKNVSHGEDIVVVKNFLSITYTTNPGGAFGLFSKYSYLLLILGIIVAVAGIVMAKKIFALPLSYQISLGLLLGGSLGNLLDRIKYGKVIDFIAFSFWPTFNIADVAICIGIGILIINMYKKG